MAIAYSQLNTEQKRAASHVYGPMLVLAGAGTGKTSVLVHRISRLISAKHARPSEIRAFTFTHKAANEIRSRVSKSSAGMAAADLHASTFHGYSYQLLREAGEDFQLLDQFELWAFLRQHVADLPLKLFLRAANPGRFLKDLLAFFDRCADELVTAESYTQYVARVAAGECPPPRVAKKKQADQMGRDEILARCQEIAAIFRAVEELLAGKGLLTFGALVARAASLLKNDRDLLTRERSRSRFLLIDEFQDSNHAQIELARVVAGEEQNIFAVGDPDQAIYHFRGASSAAFTEFVNVFQKLERRNIVNLAENQRSSQNILDVGFSAIHHNPGLAEAGSRLKFDRKQLISARDQQNQAKPSAFLFDTEPVEIVPYRDYGQEAADVAERILELHERGARWGDCAVLFRSHSSAESLVEELAARSIPYEVQDTDLFECDALRDLLAWLHCTISSSDNVSFFRLALHANFQVNVEELYASLSTALRGTRISQLLEEIENGPMLLERLRQFATEQDVFCGDLLEIVDAATPVLGIDHDSIELRRFRKFAGDWTGKRIAANGRLPEFLEFLDLYREGGGTLALAPQERPEEEFKNASREQMEARDAVKLLTIHAAKGLEFRNVFVLRLTAQSFPTMYRETLFEFPRQLALSPTPLEKSDEQIHKEEERRLFYVAVTRARDTLTLYGKTRKLKNKPDTTTGYLRDLADDSNLQLVLRTREPRSTASETPPSELPGWVALACRNGKGTIELSASAIDAYATCPLKFSLQTRWRLPEQPSAALQYGSAIHSALRDFYEAAIRGVVRTPDETVEIFRREFELAKIEEELQRKLYERQGEEQLRQFLAMRALEPKPDVVSTEKTFRFAVEDVMIRGRIDRIDRLPSGGVLVLDYKTGAPRNDIDASKSIQLGLYGMAARLDGHTVEKLAFYNLEDHTVAETKKLDEEKIHLRVLEAASGIRAGDFSPSPGFHCNYCGYRSLCPATLEKVAATNQSTVERVGV